MGQFTPKPKKSDVLERIYCSLSWSGVSNPARGTDVSSSHKNILYLSEPGRRYIVSASLALQIPECTVVVGVLACQSRKDCLMYSRFIWCM